MNKKILCVAGEPSGDMLAADLVNQIHQSFDLKDFECYGIGGPKMEASGFKSIWSIDKLSVRGYVEAIKQLPEILKIRKELIKEINHTRPSVFVGIDAPDFNLGVEKHCKSIGVPTVHFISPSIWAWRGGRIKKIKKAVDHMLCIFPFELEIYEKAGIKATYVGHPLASTIPLIPNPKLARDKLFDFGFLTKGPIGDDEVVISVLPGSRPSEIAHIAPGFFQAIKKINSSLLPKKSRFLIPIATPKLKKALINLRDNLLELDSSINIELIDGHSGLVLESCDVVLIASGTATLEAALWKKPMVISYTVPWLTAQIMKRQGYLPYVGLPNILCREFVVPELLQDEAKPENLATAVLAWINDPVKVSDLVKRFTDLHHQLQRPTSELAVQAIIATIRSNLNVD